MLIVGHILLERVSILGKVDAGPVKRRNVQLVDRLRSCTGERAEGSTMERTLYKDAMRGMDRNWGRILWQMHLNHIRARLTPTKILTLNDIIDRLEGDPGVELVMQDSICSGVGGFPSRRFVCQ